MSEKMKAEEKMKQEIESLKRQLKFYKDKLQLEVNVKKTIQATKKTTRIVNINSINYDDNLKTEPKSDKEREILKSEAKAAISNRNIKSAVIENNKINNLEISVNKFRIENEKLSETLKKGRKSALQEENDEGVHINIEEKEKNKNNSNKNVQSHSPNKLLSLTIENTSNNKNKPIVSVKLPPQVVSYVI